MINLSQNLKVYLKEIVNKTNSQMVITTDINTFTKRYKDPNWSQLECHVCMEKIDSDKMVTCENGHSCCQKHHLERIRAIYQEGRCAFEDGQGQHCFMCRCSLGDHRFSSAYFKNLRVIQAVELPKMMGITNSQMGLSSIPSTQELLDISNTRVREAMEEAERLERRRTQLGI